MPGILAALILLLASAPAAARKLPTDKATQSIAADIEKQIPKQSRVLIADLNDLDGRITYFGRYLSDKLETALVMRKPDFVVVDRSKLDLTLEEIQLQKAGLIDDATITQLGKMLGASVIVYGSVTDLDDAIDIDVKIRNIETSAALGGATRKLKKTARLAQLVRTVIKTEQDKERELEEYRAKVRKDIEIDRDRRIAAIKSEEAEKRAKLAELDKEMRLKSEVLAEYERKKQALDGQEARLSEIHSEIGRLNRGVPGKLKVGMTLAQVNAALELQPELTPDDEGCYLVGRYFLLFQGGALSGVILNGSVGEIKSPYSRSFFKGTLTVDSCATAAAFGKNRAR
ncbi:MAG: CsgG/HfaB family protein [Elusimicrobiota bacterium]